MEEKIGIEIRVPDKKGAFDDDNPGFLEFGVYDSTDGECDLDLFVDGKQIAQVDREEIYRMFDRVKSMWPFMPEGEA